VLRPVVGDRLLLFTELPRETVWKVLDSVLMTYALLYGKQ
jgi:hypothetical protein